MQRGILKFHFLLCLVASCGDAYATATTIDATLTLNIKEATDLVYKNNVTLKLAETKVREASAKLGGVWGTLLPRIDFEYSWVRSKDSIDLGVANFDGNPYNRYQSGLVFSQPIIRGGALWSAPIQSRAEYESAKIEYEISEREQLMALAKAYYALLLNQEKLATLKRQYATQTNLIAQAKRRSRIGAERKLTVLQFETQAALLKPQILDAENSAQLSAIELLNLIGHAHARTIEVRGSLEKLTFYKIMSSSEVNLESKPEVRMLDLEQTSLDAQKGVLMAEHWPSLNAVGRFGGRSFERSELFSENSREWSYGLELRIPMFSGLTSFSQRKELAARSAGLRYQERSVRDQSAIELVQSEKSFRTSIELVEAKKVAFELAKKSYQEASRMFGYGTLDYREYFDVEKDLIAAELSYLSSLYEHLLVSMRFHVATGQSLKDFMGFLASSGS